jgi:hypothetical protein
MRFDHLGTSVTLQDFVPADTDAVSEILGGTVTQTSQGQ